MTILKIYVVILHIAQDISVKLKKNAKGIVFPL